ncbi:ketoacyl-ACP synthase III family protein [Streptomyces sp. NPDC059118]|jgi:3-oxoacyl-[acyl-carrier-protein] synthase-3|uniref:ketoacyl-ACP synthase III family protein n=1 Tax=unclassified Streptomyces TaxID=2593676 RepID=UPI002E75C82B|nr:ketoacyl-ACP synthase III family protein [Streptomyces sp. JV184]MEE1748368.1 ketoacyl-ACP synthase III family protein [Streptomyces sp. JV184]
MRWQNMYVSGTGAWLPPAVSARSAVDSGEYDPEQFEADGLLSVRVAPDDVAPPDMAVQAVTTALKRSGVSPEDVPLLVHSYIYFQGIEGWPVASYVANHAVGTRVTAVELKQECNAGLAGLELAAHRLESAAPGTSAVLSTADRFGAPLMRRWRQEQGIVYGDGAAAVVLSNQRGFAKLVSTATVSNNSLEAVVRGKGFEPLPQGEQETLSERVGHYIQKHGSLREATERLVAVVGEAIDTALTDAGTDRQGLAWTVIPATGRSKMEWQVQKMLGVTEERTTWEFARRAGHLGAADQFAGLNDLAETGALRVGDKVLLVGSGSGFTCTCAVLEIVAEPDWQAAGGPGTEVGP